MLLSGILPVELVLVVLSWLNGFELAKLRLVCKELCTLSWDKQLEPAILKAQLMVTQKCIDFYNRFHVVGGLPENNFLIGVDDWTDRYITEKNERGILFVSGKRTGKTTNAMHLVHRAMFYGRVRRVLWISINKTESRNVIDRFYKGVKDSWFLRYYDDSRVLVGPDRLFKTMTWQMFWTICDGGESFDCDLIIVDEFLDMSGMKTNITSTDVTVVYIQHHLQQHEAEERLALLIEKAVVFTSTGFGDLDCNIKALSLRNVLRNVALRYDRS